MVYVFVALYAEAEPIISQLGLKRKKTEFGFDIYTIDKYNIKLVITGAGMVAAATAVGSILAHDNNKEYSTLINFGSCAGKGEIGETYVCNKIIDSISGHAFYPDILYRHDYPEKYIVTETGILKNGLGNLYQDGLHDMEASAIYQAGSHFLSPHKMSFMKVISDSGQGEKIHVKELKKTIEMGMKHFLNYLMRWIEIDIQENIQVNRKEQIYEQEFEQLCQQLHCSEAMRRTIKQYIKYWSLAGVDYKMLFQQMREQKKLPCKDKREGKKRLGELKSKLL